MRTGFQHFRSVRVLAGALGLAGLAAVAHADTTPQALPFSQNWSSANFAANDDWSAIPGIVGFLGDDASGSVTNVDPQTITSPSLTGTQDVVYNGTVTSTNGGVIWVASAGAVALQGSGSADWPYINIYVKTTGKSGIHVAYTLQELDTDNAAQQVALQYRIGDTGNYTNVPAGYVADASDGASKSTPISVTLPADADNKPLVEIRILTTNATGSDSLIGIDDISITAGGASVPDYTAVGKVLSSLNVDKDLGPFDVDTKIQAAGAVVTIDSVNLTGSPLWTVQANPGTVAMGTTGTLTFRFTPTANDGIVSTATATVVTSGNTPTSFTVNLSGSTLVDATLAQVKAAVEAGTAGSKAFRFTAYVNARNLWSSNYHEFSVQDSLTGSSTTRGALVYDPSGAGYGSRAALPWVGSQVTITGTATNYRGMTEIIPTAVYADDDTTRTIAPYQIGLDQVGDDTEGVICRVEGAHFTTDTAKVTYTVTASSTVSVAGNKWADKDGNSGVQLYAPKYIASWNGSDVVIDGRPVADGGHSYFVLTGLVQQYDGSNPLTGGTGYEFSPRYQSDIIGAEQVPVELSSFEIE